MTEYATYFETMGRKARAASTAMQLADTAVKINYCRPWLMYW